METLQVRTADIETFYRHHAWPGPAASTPYAQLTDGAGHQALAHYNAVQRVWEPLLPPPRGPIQPKNAEQRFVMDALQRPEYACVAVSGATGSGKTLLAVAMGAWALERGGVRAMTLIKPHVEVGRSLGYLPGTAQEKMDPYYQSFYFAFEELGGSHQDPLAHWRATEQIEWLPVNYVRGITLRQRWVIIDEAQNLTRHELKTLLTRIGDESKVVLCGDLGQVDTRQAGENGFQYVLERFAGEPLFCALTLTRVLRGPVAEAAERLL